LVVRGDELNLYVQSVIVHELAHALDDQWYDLDRPEVDEVDEASFGFSAIVEGSARLTEDAWTDELSDDEAAEMLAQQLAFEAEMIPSLDLSTYMVLAPILGAPYELGSALIVDMVDAEGADRLADAFNEPPISSEQVLHPDRFLEGDEPLEVETPPADGDEEHSGVLGEFLLQMALADELPASVARTAAEGWGGDAYVVWREGDERCLRVDIEADTDDDLQELEQALVEWAGEQPDAEVEVVGERVRLTSCV
jgi:hypothetical protein